MCKNLIAKYDVNVAKEIGITSAILLAHLTELQETSENDYEGYFCTTSQEISNATALTYENQRTAMSKLKKAGLIDVTRKGIPAKNYFKLL